MRALKHLALLPLLAGLVLCLAACRVDGYFVLPDSSDASDAEPPVNDWVTRLGGAGHEGVGAIATAPNGDIVLAGSFQGTTVLGGAPITAIGTGYDIWVARYRPDGSHVWSIGMGGDNWEFVYEIATDSAGDVYVVGYNWGAVNFGGGERPYRGGFLVKLSGANGAYIWDRTFGAPMDPYFSNRANGVTVIASDKVVMCGRFTGTVNFGGGNRTSTPLNGTDWFLAAYESATGVHLWSNPLTSTGSEQVDEFGPERCSVIAVDGDVIVTGLFRGTATLGGASLVALGDTDVFVARFRSADGTHLWSKRHGGMGYENAYKLATHETRVFVGGEFKGAANFGGADLDSAGTDAFVAAYSISDGNHVWSQRFGGASEDRISSLAVNSTQLTTTIAFVDTIMIGDRSLNASPSDISNPDIAIARFAPENGSPIGAWHFGSSVLDSNGMLVAYVDRQLAGAGTFKQTTSLFGTTLTSQGEQDVAVFRVDLDRATYSTLGP